jgi:hypothetical protein
MLRVCSNNYFGSCPSVVPPLEDVIRSTDLSGYVVCGVCGKGVHSRNLDGHMKENHGSTKDVEGTVPIGS